MRASYACNPACCFHPLPPCVTCSTSKELVRDGRPGDTFPLLAEGLQVRPPAGTSGAHIDNPSMRCISWVLTLP